MSELKARHVVDVYDNYSEHPCKESSQVYLKSEVDKVIAEKDKEIEEQKRLRDMALASVPNALKVMKIIQHNKYKRCLAMARWCEVTAMWCYQAANTLPEGFRATLYGKPVMIEPSRLFKRSVRLNNWVNRWRKLAEKFKPNKSTAQQGKGKQNESNEETRNH